VSTLLATPRVEVALRVLAAGVGILFLLMGLGFLVMPEVLATALLAAEPARAVGINSLRGDFGGLFLGLSLFTLVGTSTRHRWLLLVPIVFLALIVMGRLISLAVDDLPLVAKGALASELAFLAILALSMRSTSLSPDAGGRAHVGSVVFRKRFALAIAIMVALVTLAF